MFEPTKMNQLILGWGMKQDEFMVDFNQTGEFRNLPNFVKEFGLVPVQVGENFNFTENLTNYTHYQDDFQLNANIRKRSVGFKSRKMIFNPILVIAERTSIGILNPELLTPGNITLKTSWDAQG